MTPPPSTAPLFSSPSSRFEIVEIWESQIAIRFTQHHFMIGMITSHGRIQFLFNFVWSSSCRRGFFSGRRWRWLKKLPLAISRFIWTERCARVIKHSLFYFAYWNSYQIKWILINFGLKFGQCQQPLYCVNGMTWSEICSRINSAQSIWGWFFHGHLRLRLVSDFISSMIRMLR